jgi:hypothetical protein
MYWYSSSIKLIKVRAAFSRNAANWQNAAKEASDAGFGAYLLGIECVSGEDPRSSK